jgi:hypothetical protein
MEENKIYRVFDSKKRYKQSYSAKLRESYSWAIDCAKSEKGFNYEDVVDEKGEKISSKIVYPKK